MEKILIIGGTGSLGKKLIKRLGTTYDLVVYSRDESKHWTIQNELKSSGLNLAFRVGDIRDKQRVKQVIQETRPDIIIMAAALKQVDTCELSPQESILTNLVGTQNVIDVVEELNRVTITSVHSYSPKKVLFVSTDKACSPANVYGMCKAISERYVTSKAADTTLTTQFVGVRYGNVLESRGSIIPLFKYQSEHAEAFTVTHADMTRFLMTLDDSVDLILHALSEGKSGEIWIPRLKAMNIKDLAEIYSKMYSKPIKYIGLRPGEKMHESLLNDSESVRTRDTGVHYVIGPAFESPKTERMFEYTSADDVMSKDELYEYLESINIFDKNLSDFEGKSIEEIRTK